MLGRQEETRSLWHDIKKYMASIESLINLADTENAKKELEFIKSTFPNMESVVDSGNALIDSILEYGMKKAKDVGVTIKPETWVESDLGIPATDLFVIIGNTLDNAIEASSIIPEDCRKIVTCFILQKNHVLHYEISNPYIDGNCRKAGKIHGYGLKNVQACVERNSGIMSISKKQGIYRVSIQLNLE